MPESGWRTPGSWSMPFVGHSQRRSACFRLATERVASAIRELLQFDVPAIGKFEENGLDVSGLRIGVRCPYNSSDSDLHLQSFGVTVDDHYKKLMQTRLALSGLMDSPLLSIATLRMIESLKQDLEREIEEYRKVNQLDTSVGSQSAD